MAQGNAFLNKMGGAGASVDFVKTYEVTETGNYTNNVITPAQRNGGMLVVVSAPNPGSGSPTVTNLTLVGGVVSTWAAQWLYTVDDINVDVNVLTINRSNIGVYK